MKKRLVIVSGACGSGKSELRSVALESPAPSFGETAAIETDWLYVMADPQWRRSWPRNERYVALARDQCALLAASFFDAGFHTVLVVGNSLHERQALHPFLGLAREVGSLTSRSTRATSAWCAGWPRVVTRRRPRSG